MDYKKSFLLQSLFQTIYIIAAMQNRKHSVPLTAT